MDKIKFRCSSCDRTLAIDAVHAGKVIACPGCRAKLRLPTAPDNAALTTSSTSPLPSQASKPQTEPPAKPRKTANPFEEDFGGTFDDDASTGKLSSANEPYDSMDLDEPRGPARSKTSFGRSLGGAAAAIFLGGFFSVVWVLIVAFSGYELGILAWGMGGAIGFSAGIIARNPSGVFCGLIAGIAVMSVLLAKGIMLGMILLAIWGMGFLANLEGLMPDHQELSHAVADQMLEDGEFSGVEKEYAEIYTSSYFSGDGESYDQMTDEHYEVAEDVRQQISERVSNATDEEKEKLLEAARARHPEWIEDDNHYHAIVDQLFNEEGALDDDLTAQAEYELKQLEGDWDREYNNSVARTEVKRRSSELRKMVVERLGSMDEEARDQAVRDALQRHPKWDAFPDAYMAMLAKLYDEDQLDGPLAEHAQATVENRMKGEGSDYFDNVARNDSEAREDELRALVSEKLATMDAAAREALVAETRTRYPDWVGEELTAEQAQKQIEETKQQMFDELGTDGTMLGNLGAVFGFMDIIWLILSATTAYGVAHKYGIEE